MITANKLVKVNYTLRENNSEGEIIESTYNAEPLEFVFGQGRMIPLFEEKLNGLKEGEKFSFVIESDDAYGAFNEQAIIDLDINIFEAHGKIDYEMLTPGNKIPMRDSEGRRMDGLVIEVTDKNVKMDFNHPLAGKDLHFEGEILTIADASEEDMMSSSCGCGSGGHKHNHENSEDSCGCGSGEHKHEHKHNHENSEDSCGCGNSSCGCN